MPKQNKNRWFEFAEEDKLVAKASLDKEIYNQACFHAHQGVEKMLKGYLAEKNKDIPKTHFIGVLLRLCFAADERFNVLGDRCLKLDNYYIPTRYPDALPGGLREGMPNKEDAREASAVLEEVMILVEKLSGLTG